MWCWISTNWSLIRIYSYYIPVWICIFLSIAIYCAVGYHVFHHRNQLRNMAYNLPDKDNSTESRPSTDEKGFIGDVLYPYNVPPKYPLIIITESGNEARILWHRRY